MKNLLIKSAVVLALVSLFAQAENWEDDWEKAKKEAAEKNLPILIDFSGSDWCGWCIKLDREVFSKNEFKKYARKNLVLFLADFPRKKSQSKKLKAQNKELASEFGIRGFPTIILTTPEGEKIAKTGYKAGGPEKYVEHLKELLKDYKPKAAEDKKKK